MRPDGFFRKQFQFYRLWILERSLPLRGAADAMDGDDSSEVAPPPGVDVRFLDRHERRDWVCEHASDEDWPQFRVALQHDHDLVMAKRAEKTVGWAWVGYERVFLPPLGREIHLPPGVAYLYESYVRPAERGHGIGKRLVGARCRRAASRSATRALTHVVSGNHASLRTLRAHGFEIVGRTHFLRVLLLRFWTRAPLPVASRT